MSNGLFNTGRNLLDTAGQYYLGKEGQEGALAAGQAALATGEQIGRTAGEMAGFKPYTVTSALATGATTPEGGLDLQLSPEEQARQQARFEQAEGLFGRVGIDPAQATSDYYEALRAAQRPEEERQRLRMQEGLFSRGRGGLSSGMYGGTPEQFAFDKAVAEAQLGAAAGARQQALAEQQQALGMAGALTGQAYMPQQQALNLFGAASTPADIAGAARRQAGSLYGSSAIQGLQGMMQGEKLANELRQQQIEAMIGGVTGSRNPKTGELEFGALESLFNYVTGNKHKRYSDAELDSMTEQEREDALYDIFN